MSYLSLPRIHFAGAFFANPSNLNNTVENYLNAQQGEALIYETGTYNNPTGVGQFFFRDCVITQSFDEHGQANSQDSFIGTPVETVNTWEPQQAPDGSNYILAKMADLDPEMQFRTELYGVRIFIKDAQGYGLEGYMATPQLRDLFFNRGAGGDQGMQVACGTWHQRFYVTKWSLAADDKTSTLALLKQITHNNQLDIKLSTDMFQCDPQQQFTVGNRYCYGRMMATIGPVQQGMPMQIVPGRRLYSPQSFDSLSIGQSSPNLQNALKSAIVSRDQAEKELPKATQETQPSNTNSDVWWNNTDARVVKDSNGQHFLLIDMGTTTRLKEPSNGEFDLGQSLEIGYLDASDKFTPFSQQGYLQSGQLVSLHDQLQDFIQLPEAAQYRDSAFLKNAGVVQIQLSADEAEKIANLRLGLQLEQASVLRENEDGYYINFDTASGRMSPNGQLEVNVTAFCFGQGLTKLNTADSVPLDIQILDRVYDKQQDSSMANFTHLSAAIGSQPVAAEYAQFPMSIKTASAEAFAPKPTDNSANNWLRQPLDSLICYINVTSSQYLIGENPFNTNFPLFIPAVSVLFWQNQFVTGEHLTWDDNIQPILNIYSQLYPGMTSRMDIGNQETVVANASAFKERFNLDVQDPAFMPVVRDMSPETIQMMNRWLDVQIQQSQQDQETA